MNESELNDLLSCPFCGMPAVGPELENPGKCRPNWKIRCNQYCVSMRRGSKNGVVAEYVYKTDDIILPEDAQAFQFPDTEKYGWMPELVGGEWIKEDEE